VGGFVNRLNEMDLLDTVAGIDGAGLPQVGLFVIAGTAGVGKTSLAIHWAHRIHQRFPDGQLCVNLRGYDPGTPLTADAVLDRFLRALEVGPTAIPADVEAKAALYRTLLADRRALILLDNAATAAQVRPLLPGSPGCLVLVTSRNRLSGLGVRDGARRLTLDLFRIRCCRPAPRPDRQLPRSRSAGRTRGTGPAVRSTAVGAADRGRTGGQPPQDATGRPHPGPARRVSVMGRAQRR
jgi:hypothetical protein